MAEDTQEVPTVSIDVAEKRTKPRLEALLLADYASITISKKPDICGVFDEFSVDPEKKNTGFFYLYIRTAETVEGGLGIAIFDPNGNLIGSAATVGAPNIETGNRRLSLLQRFALDTPMAGEYWIDVSYKGQSLGGTSFVVKYNKEVTSNDIDSK